MRYLPDSPVLDISKGPGGRKIPPFSFSDRHLLKWGGGEVVRSERSSTPNILQRVSLGTTADSPFSAIERRFLPLLPLLV